MIVIRNLFRDLPSPVAEEHFDPLLTRKNVRLERICSLGHRSPPDFWYDQDADEWVLLLQGAARLWFADPEEEIGLAPGDSLLIPRRRRHRVVWTDPHHPTLWLALHLEGGPP